jgi:hypothetical protein
MDRVAVMIKSLILSVYMEPVPNKKPPDRDSAGQVEKNQKKGYFPEIPNHRARRGLIVREGKYGKV